MDDYKSLSHTEWECKYHVCSFQVPQERALRRTEAVPRDVFCKLALQKESRIEQVHLMPDRVQTVGRDEAAIREYIKNQQQGDKRLDQLNLWRRSPPSGGWDNWGRVSDPNSRFERPHH
jgi:putative transposase